MESPWSAGSSLDALRALLDASADFLSSEHVFSLAIPDDELHSEILLPLLPALLQDKVIRQHWLEQSGSGFYAQLRAYLGDRAARPRWTPSDLEIHVAASYSAGPDAKALADTLLSEEPLRYMAAALLNQILEHVLTAVSVIEGAKPAASPIEGATGPTYHDPVRSDSTPGAPGATPTPQPRRSRHPQVPAPPWTVRPHPWKTRTNPIRGRDFVCPGFPNWLAVNPLHKRAEGGHVWTRVTQL